MPLGLPGVEERGSCDGSSSEAALEMVVDEETFRDLPLDSFTGWICTSVESSFAVAGGGSPVGSLALGAVPVAADCLPCSLSVLDALLRVCFW